MMFLLCLLGLVTALSCATSTINEAAFSSADIISKDVAIIGGGATGTYAAVRLREDYKKSVVVVEQADHLGGHVNTYHDPISNTDIDYGVLVYLDYGPSAAFFKRLGVPTKLYEAPPPGPVLYPSSMDGSNLTAYTPPAFPDAATAIAKWGKLIEPYSPQLLDGFWNFWEPSQVPNDLLSPFGDFATKNGIQAAMPLFGYISNVGVGGVRDILTLYVAFAFGEPVVQGFINGTEFVPDGFSNSELYIRALKLLQNDVMLQSRVVATERNDHGVKLVVKDSSGCQKLIKARRLLFTPPPSLQNLAPFDLDDFETKPLTTWTGTWSFVAIARIPSIPINYTVTFTSPAAVHSNWLDIRDMPYALSLSSTGLPGEDLFEVIFSTNYSISYDDAKATITEAVQNLTSSGTLPASNDTVDFLAFNDHNSVLWRQSPELLRSGIVQDIYSLQGHRSTWYSASLLAQDYTGTAWAFVDTVLPRLLKGL